MESVSDSNGAIIKTVTMLYDHRNFLISEEGSSSITSLLPDALGQLLENVDGNGVATSIAYDNLRRLATITQDAYGSDPATAGAVTQFGYDDTDRVTMVTDANGGVTSYTYNDFGDLLSIESPDTGTVTFVYDASGNTTQKTDAMGHVYAYSYDAANRLTGVDAPGDSGDITYTYDLCLNGVGQLCSVTTAESIVSNTYTAFSELQMHQGVTYEYTESGKVKRIVYPSGVVIDYLHNVADRIRKVTFTIGAVTEDLVANISYVPFGPLQTISYGNGLELTQTIDADLEYRLASQYITGVMDVSADYDANNNLISRALDFDWQDFSYDAHNRLISHSDFTNGYEFSYDSTGNRLQEVSGAEVISYEHQPGSNRLIAIDEVPVVLDANGNTLVLRDLVLEYDVHNRLVGVQRSGLTIATYVYNALGQRIQKTLSGGNTIRYIYGITGDLLAETDVTGNSLKEYVYQENNLLAVIDFDVDGNSIPDGTAPELYYAHNDHLGTPVKLTGPTGNVIWSASYQSFGEATVESDPDEDGTFVTLNIRFPGQYYDHESGLHYNYFRYYDPSTGRYITSDPIGLNGGLNTYAYVLNNPLKFIDPTGLSTAVVDRGNGIITVTMNNGQTVTYPAGNNTTNPSGDPNTVGSNGPAPAGTWPVQSPVNTSGDVRYGPYFWPIGAVDAQGNRADIARQRGIGLHGGRRSHQSRTQGCVRMDDADILDLYQRTTNDPLTTIEIR